jgi:hypothetical protein
MRILKVYDRRVTNGYLLVAKYQLWMTLYSLEYLFISRGDYRYRWELLCIDILFVPYGHHVKSRADLSRQKP